MTSLVSVRTYAIPQFYCARVCFGGKLHGLPPASVWREVGCCRPHLFGGKLHRQLRFTKKITFFQDDKIQSQAMNKSNNMERKERDIDREESRKQATNKGATT